MFFLDIDECASSPCLGRGTCTDGAMGWECSCSEPYYGSTCEHGQYSILTLCLRPGWWSLSRSLN